MYSKYQLKNGLKVILAESQKSPVVSVQMWVKTGSADESKNEEGISHFIEHLVFKGTEKFGVGEIASTVEGSGGELNAYTSFDQTVFYVTISKTFLDVGLDCISQMMGFPKFDADEIDKEREVVIEEIKRTQDSPHRQSGELLFKTLYKKHPYGRPVIGYDHVIKQVSRDVLTNYYHRRYVPENMTLVVAGAIDPEKIKSSIESFYGSFPVYKLKKTKRTPEALPKSARVQVRQWSFKENLMYLSWPVPSAEHPDTPALDMLALVLGSGDSSRLTNALRIAKPLVNSVGASTFTPLDRGFFTISASLQMPKLEEALKELLHQMEMLLTAGPRSDEILKAIVAFEGDEYYSMETVDGLARKVGHFEHLFGNYKYFQKFLNQIRKVRSEDLLRVARKYLTPDRLAAVASTQEDKNKVETALKKFVREYGKLFRKATKARIKKNTTKNKSVKFVVGKPKAFKDFENQIIHKNLLSGVDVILRPNYDTPVMNLRLAYLGGMRSEIDSNNGITELLSRTWSARTRGMSEEQLSSKVESMASSISSFGGRNTCGLNMTTLANFSNEAREILSQLLVDPFLTEEIVNREKIFVVEQQRKRDDNPAQLAILQFMLGLFGAHPYSRDPLGSRENIERLHANDVLGFLKQFRNQKGLKIVAAGHLDPDEWLDYLTTTLKALPDFSRKESRYNFMPPSENKLLFRELQKEQTHIVVGYPGLTFNDKSRYALEVATSILSGQGGRLFLELRDKESLAYSVSPIKMEGIDAGYFAGYIGCSPEKATKSISMLKAEFSKLASTSVDSAELDRAKRFLIGRHDIELQRSSAVISNILFDVIYGQPADETFRYSERIIGVTAEDVRKTCEKIFSSPSVISVVGATKPSIE